MSQISTRNQTGSAVVTMLILCLLCGLLLTAMFGSVLPSYQRTTIARTASIARTAAESTVDWAVDQFANAGTRSNIDVQNGSFSRTIYMPSNLLPAGVNNCMVTVSAVNCPKTASCYWDALDSTLPATTSVPAGPYQLGASPTPWRVLRVDSTMATGFTKSIRVVLMPVVTSNPNGGQTTQQVPIFQYALASYTNVTGNTPSTPIKTYGYDSSKGGNPQTSKETVGGDVAANGSIDLGNSNIGGKVQTFGAAGSGNITGKSAKVYETLTASGTAPNAVIGTGGGSGKINVLNNKGEQEPLRQNFASTPIPKITIPPHAGAANLPSSGNVTKGMYKVTTLASQNITISSGPVDIFVEGASAKVDFKGTINVSSGKPSDLRIWYSGSEDVHLDNGKQFTGVVYAPNALVHFDNGGKMYGAVLAKAVVLDNGSEFFYDKMLSDPNSGLTYPVTTQAVPTCSINPNDGYRVISWQEL